MRAVTTTSTTSANTSATRALSDRAYRNAVVARRVCRRFDGSFVNARATPRPSGPVDDDDDDDAFLRALEAQMDGGSASADASDGLNWGGEMSGDELRDMVLKRYGRLYDVRICQRRDRFNKLQIYFQIMWKFLGQKSFPMSEQEYIEQTDAVAELLSEWDVGDIVRENLPKNPKTPKMDTTGANAVMIPLGLDVENGALPGTRERE
ncbi:Protein of unknown function DUF3067 [Ostreococcus tauri]|uniref:Uncharacterized protein n=1 Tax=Ostreococcus tauri TaxID=70448 RepID=Q013I8_OSTTA|nr:Protein of unknown function DUF3067 [Ostreococcus tauri]OUS46959.1 hypothetical protein BE221DRAFT_191475 [Ostreococcus tauri]CAL54942.1 Protein of unknown function DUF3067 [Ostreococcus tauri]|eukprot:XP_003080774.1 Protein of unknown function DUF3067 [Ostreococcus tauri]